jgi:hypothetical protein
MAQQVGRHCAFNPCLARRFGYHPLHMPFRQGLAIAADKEHLIRMCDLFVRYCKIIEQVCERGKRNYI